MSPPEQILADATPPKPVDYSGPSRFFPADAASGGTLGPANDRTPLTNQQQIRLDHGLWGVLSTEYVSLRGNWSRAEEARYEYLQAEYKALRQAGYRSLACTYGPFKNVDRVSGAPLRFWYERRAEISPTMLAEVKRQNGASFDVALTECPRTWAEALAVGSGRQAAPDATQVATAQAQLMEKTGMRYLPVIPGMGAFDDTRQLVESIELGAPDMHGTYVRENSRARWEASSPDMMRDTVLRLDDVGQKVLLCKYAHEGGWSETYGNPDIAAFSPAFSGPSRSAQHTMLRFWFRTKPEGVSAEFIKAIGSSTVLGQNDRILVDIAIDKCPALYGGAMALIDGSAEAKAIAKRAESTVAGLDASLRLREDEDARLLREIRRVIDGLEANVASLTPQAFKREVEGPLKLNFSRVSSSALNKLGDIPAGADRKRFDAWDRTLGGPLLDAIRRLYLVAQKRAFRLETSGAGFRDLFQSGEQMKNEQTAWIEAARAQLYTRPVYQALVAGYDRHLAGRPLLEPSVLARARRDAPISESAATAQPPSAGAKQETVTVIFGTPGEIAAARFGDAIGAGVGGALQSAGELSALHQQLTSRIAGVRAAFWQCYENRCADIGRRYADYSTALRDKDVHYLFQPVLYEKLGRDVGGSPGDQRLIGTLMQFLGAGGVDDGVVLGCENQAASFKEVFAKQVAGVQILDVQSLLGRYTAATAFPEYLSWQTCRDRMEYLLRTRRQ